MNVPETPTISPGAIAHVTVRVRDRVSTGWMCSLLDRTGEVQAQQVIPSECLNLYAKTEMVTRAGEGEERGGT